ncbi:hypothetical protein HID58_090095 [Brassica napus]|uniref:NADH-quinone oxidoreductase subunit D domain-containing protein n=1 Tax=Brassica napus TaxID=3708 RepID=A0ABQ7XE61_BRANA|nr:hypothetical protein HID58_090095 [Brassica napus]
MDLLSYEKKEESKGSVEFQVVSFTNKIRRLTSHLELHRKDYLSQRVYEKFWENVNDCWLICQKKIDNLIHTKRIKEKPYEETSYRRKISYDSQYGTSPPIMHGVLRLIVTLDGEDRNGKIAETEHYTIFTLCNAVGLLATMFTEAITVNGPEQLGNIQSQLYQSNYARIESYSFSSVMAWPFYGRYWAQTPFFYIFREREFVYDLFEAATGMRMMHNFFRIGGIAADLPYGWIDKCLDFCDYFLTENELKALGLLVGRSINWGLSGPMLRASGIHGIFVKLIVMSLTMNLNGKFSGKTRRFISSIHQIIQQALEGLPGGPYENLESRGFDKKRNPEWNDFEYRFISKKPSPTFELSKQELYEIKVVFLGDGNPTAGMKLADIMTILGSIDIIMGEVDR